MCWQSPQAPTVLLLLLLHGVCNPWPAGRASCLSTIGCCSMQCCIVSCQCCHCSSSGGRGSRSSCLILVTISCWSRLPTNPAAAARDAYSVLAHRSSTSEHHLALPPALLLLQL